MEQTDPGRVRFVWFGCSAAQQVVVGYSAVSSLLLPYWVGKEAGFYNQERLDERLVYIPSSSTTAQAMLAGNVAISSANGQVVVEIGLQRGDLIAMGSVINVAAFYVMAPPEIRTVADLKGRPVGVTRFGASTDFGIRQLLKKHGLEPFKDVPILQIGGMPELKELIAGKIFGRESADEITCFINNIGLGLQFAALGAGAYQQARSKGIGKEIPTEWFLQSVHP